MLKYMKEIIHKGDNMILIFMDLDEDWELVNELEVHIQGDIYYRHVDYERVNC